MFILVEFGILLVSNLFHSRITEESKEFSKWLCVVCTEELLWAFSWIRWKGVLMFFRKGISEIAH